MNFNQTSSQSITNNGASQAQLLNLTGSPTVAILAWSTAVAGGPAPAPPGNPALFGDPVKMASVWVALGGANVAAGPSNGFLLAPNGTVRIPLTAAMTYIAALGIVGTGLWVNLGTES